MRQWKVAQRRAFTAAELIVVLLIFGISAAVAVPRFTRSLSRGRADAAARRIIADLALAQRNAKMTSSSKTVIFAPSTDLYEIDGLRSIDHPAKGYTVRLGDATYQVDLVKADLGGDAQVVFDGYGRPDSGGTIAVQVGQVQVTISLDADTGRAAIE